MAMKKSHELFELTPEQEKAFARLEKAYKECKKVGIFFYNVYGRLSAVDGKKIEGYGFEPSDISTADLHDTAKSIEIPNEWADDTHYWSLTAKGKRILKSEGIL
jgi:hypothetical protein